ncbi:hypothetical protein [Streptantibioticus cattleyicolor]|uniref:Uncharacterized protein n=1 Tax=Streptantibioticus cattleyicolor (strain ATCC 35852 / DSM 46488 / JCM 4925 / NBRC 14057 / NRRL 8057) TaxID=1003195 RepID=F8JJW6_STREN|nr:hypothetical protein [Streptantibioticus cattleyicolor]AEW98606.1 hypothetical protein SCATT_p04130 [Streptantibioticus cattleyicolor NRRL 8057 = DSM 46488]CCB72335.1 protein of unknown function [Streptantibioticus cattleyicolor NRRL 8057 = DSM 46488]
MHSNSLDDIVNSIRKGEPVVLVHKGTGGYARRDGDLQIVPTPISTADGLDKHHAHYLRMDLGAQHKGNNLYTFESLQIDDAGHRVDTTPVMMSANPADISGGIVWAPRKKIEDHPDDKEAKAQYWYVIPQECCGGYAILPYLDPVWALGLIDKSEKLPACGRPVQTIYAVIPVLCLWDIVAPKPDKECIRNDKIPQV